MERAIFWRWSEILLKERLAVVEKWKVFDVLVEFWNLGQIELLMDQDWYTYVVKTATYFLCFNNVPIFGIELFVWWGGGQRKRERVNKLRKGCTNRNNDSGRIIVAGFSFQLRPLPPISFLPSTLPFLRLAKKMRLNAWNTFSPWIIESKILTLWMNFFRHIFHWKFIKFSSLAFFLPFAPRFYHFLSNLWMICSNSLSSGKRYEKAGKMPVFGIFTKELHISHFNVQVDIQDPTRIFDKRTISLKTMYKKFNGTMVSEFSCINMI